MTDPTFWFAEWAPTARILLIGGCGYIALLLALNLTGARTLAQMNSFDFVVTLAIGASFGRVLTARDIPLAELVAAVGLLIILQFLMTKLQIGLPGTRRILSARPVLLFRDGEFRDDAMRRARVEEREGKPIAAE